MSFEETDIGFELGIFSLTKLIALAILLFDNLSLLVSTGTQGTLKFQHK